MAEILKLEKAIEEIRKDKERKFNQSVDLIINLKDFDIKKTQINTFVALPHKIKDKRICGFIETKTNVIDTISKKEFPTFKNKKDIKVLVGKYDFFISSAQNMPAVATTFGRVLGPAGKMPSPKMGILMQESPEEIKSIVEKVSKSIRLQTKEPSIKVIIGKVSMKDSEIMDNINAVYRTLLNELPKGKENIRSLMIKLTMSHPIKFEI
ncbi:MAG: hypothetical protein WC533_00180 [Candidatus Pacearchaeota archaeon]